MPVRNTHAASGEHTPSSRRALVRKILSWYNENARDLPWRRAGASPWSIMVSEFMLQQTPVTRVLEPWQQWMERWPTPAALAAAPSGEAVRAWGRLGYPRRALRLHQAATIITDEHDGSVPDDHETLLSLPGVGAYTAAAILSFSFQQRHTVLDTNVRRVLARVDSGVAFPAPAASAAEYEQAELFVPSAPAQAAKWAVASMELGAVICTAQTPRCGDCPVAANCQWRLAGRPDWDGPPRKSQSYAGTDRQCRGALLAVLRSNDEPVPRAELLAAWGIEEQRERALDSLLADGLAVQHGSDRFALPH